MFSLFCGNTDWFVADNITLPRLFDIPHVAECIQDSALTLIPVAFFFVFLPVVLYALHTSTNGPLRAASPLTFRIIFCFIAQQIIGIVILLRLGVFGAGAVVTSTYVVSLIVQYIAMSVMSLIMLASRNRGLLYSGVIFNFWLLLTLCSLPRFYFRVALLFTIDASSMNLVENMLFVIYFPLVLLTFLLCCFVDIPAYRQVRENVCPERMTSFLNQLTFVWFEPIMQLGFRRALTMDDLWELPEEDCSKHLYSKFNAIWLPYLEKFNARRSCRSKSLEKVTLLTEKGFSESQTLFLKNGEKVDTRENGMANAMKHEDTTKSAGAKKPKSEMPSLLWPLLCMFEWFLLAGAFYKLIFDLMQFVAPHLLKYLIDFIQHSERPMWIGVGLALTMFVVASFQSLLIQQYFHYMYNIGMHIRAVLTSAVYKKALLLSSTARRGRTIGEIVNLMSIDIQRFQDSTIMVMLIWSSPLQIGLATYFLWRLLGVSIFAGLLVLVLMIPLNFVVSKKLQKLQMEQMRHKDERMRVLAEMLNGIKVLKLYAWETSIQKTILDLRKRERAVLRKVALVTAVNALTCSCAPFLVAVVTFGIYVSIDMGNNVLTPQITFVGLSLFNVLRFPLAVFAMVVNNLNQCIVGYNRLRRFLAEEEVDSDATISLPLTTTDFSSSEDIAVRLRDATHSWDRSGNEILRNISLDIKKGELVAVVGRIGSGKSSLISAILGEMYRHSGTVETKGKIAYVQQQAWIQNLTLMDNILFGRSLNAQFYDDILEACALKSDLAALPSGDQTEIGEKGINLSGGQKQRVSIARAVYADTDIYLLDDPLAAVDAHVGKQIFENIIGSEKGLLKNKTRIFVTHGLHFLKHCDQIVVFKDGEISERGTFKELVNSNGAFAEILEEFLLDGAKVRMQSSSFDNDNDDELGEVLAELERLAPERKRKIVRQISTSSQSGNAVCNDAVDEKSKSNRILSSRDALNKTGLETKVRPAAAVAPTARSTLIEKETAQMGHVKFSVYLSYFRAIGFAICVIFVVLFFASAVLGVASNLWLADWSDHAAKIQSQNNSSETHIRLFVYTSLGMSQALCIAVASALISMGMVSAGIFLHERMLKNILRVPMAFFDVTPVGRILNRFGKDMDFVDTRLPGTLIHCVSTGLQSLATLVVPLIVTPVASAPVFGILCVYIFVTRYYISTSRQLKRLESITRSPIFAHFQESVQGASSIRAFGATQRFLTESQKRVDCSLKANYPSLVANRWLTIRLELVGNFIVLCSALSAALFRENITAGLAGLSVTYALTITQTLNWAVRMSSELEANIVAVERIEEYSVIPSEASAETPANVNLAETWPHAGEIHFEKLELKYRPELNPVLKGISARIKPREKIGIIGRTGAGKSSLTLALFRLVEPSSGRVVIDDLNISDLGLHDLRSRLTIVPQDPVLFSGTLRKNLDPFDKFSDDDIDKALQLTYLSDFVSGLTNGLSHQISDGGENISVGERQLICLARAVLRQSRIIVLDEAAASIDIETEQLIQKTIAEQFSACTVLTIAHRLSSVMTSERIMVFEQGQLVEFDTPTALLRQKDSVFYSLAVDAGVIVNQQS